MALKFDINIPLSKELDKFFRNFDCFCFAAMHQRCRPRDLPSPPVRQTSPEVYCSRSSSVAAPSHLVVSRILKLVISWQRF